MEIHLDSIDFDVVTIIDRNGNRASYSIQEDLKIDEINLNKEFMEQSSRFAWWSNLSDVVKRYQEAEQRKLETLGAQLNLSIRQQYEQQGKKPTKDMIDSSIKINQDYQNQERNVEEWNYKYNQLNSVVKAFQQRVNALTHLGAELRQTNKNGGITNPFSH